MALVSLELALGYVKQDAGVDDAVVEILLEGATAAAVTYLNRKVYETDEDMEAAISAGTAGAYPMVADGVVKVAILKALAELYANRGDSTAKAAVQLPLNSRSMLSDLRIGPGV